MEKASGDSLFDAPSLDAIQEAKERHKAKLARSQVALMRAARLRVFREIEWAIRMDMPKFDVRPPEGLTTESLEAFSQELMDKYPGHVYGAATSIFKEYVLLEEPTACKNYRVTLNKKDEA
jgi:hypothetical protein